MTNPTLPRLLFLLSLPALILPLHAGAQEAEPPAEAPVATSPPEAVPEPPPVVLTPEAVNAAMFDGNPLPEEGQSPIVLKLQVLLDRAGFSPGVIDGVMGDNVEKAIIATEFVAGLPQDGLLDAEVWNVLQPLARDSGAGRIPDHGGRSRRAVRSRSPLRLCRAREAAAQRLSHAERDVRRAFPHGPGPAPPVEPGRRLRGARHGDRRDGGRRAAVGNAGDPHHRRQEPRAASRLRRRQSPGGLLSRHDRQRRDALAVGHASGQCHRPRRRLLLPAGGQLPAGRQHRAGSPFRRARTIPSGRPGST